MLDPARYAALGLQDILEKVLASERLSAEDGLKLFHCPDLAALGALALHVRLRLHGTATHYVVNRQINYSNICVNDCLFCAFRRDSADEAGAFVLTQEEILQKVLQAKQEVQNLDELHIVGGCHPSLRLAWFEDLFKQIHDFVPDLPLKAFTPVEIKHFADLEGCSTSAVLARLKAVGLQMLPGGGAEIFDEQLRSKLCPRKATASEWLRIAGEAHALGLKTNCTMLFGHVENYAQRIDHLCRLRAQQDQSHGFVCFIPLPFLQRNSKLLLPVEQRGPQHGLDHLRTIAVARLMLDNIPHLKAYWVMLGVKLAQAAQWYGADDLDGTIIEEHIGHMAGARSEQGLSLPQLERMIRASGFRPVRRNALFQEIATDQQEIDVFSPAHSAFKESPEVLAEIAKLQTGARLDRKGAEILYLQASLHTLADLANQVRWQKHPEKVVTFVGDRNINYSNICVCGCRFCAFFRPPGHPEGYVISRAELTDKIEETLRLGGTQILLQGGHHPDLPLEWYEELLHFMRAKWPELHIHAFSPPEIYYWSKIYHLSVREILQRLRKAGLDSIPGGGAEVLVNAVRAQVSPNKCSADQWLAVMEEAHRLGLRTTATMMFGHEEQPADRLAHLFAVRELQDRTQGFTAFIPWTFQPFHTKIACDPLPSPAYLRLLALSRLVLDNVDNIQASWVTMGPEIAQIALFYGANDFGSLMIEENVVAAAGVSYKLTRQEICHIIRAAGFKPVQRNMYYQPVKDK